MGARAMQILDKIQDDLDSGLNITQTASKNGIHHEQIRRLIAKGFIEVYIPFDEEEDQIQLVQNFEWLWEEDKLEELTNDAFDNYYAVLPDADSRNEDDLKISKYVCDNYGSIKGYLEKKGKTILGDFIFKKCSACGDLKPITRYYESIKGFMGLYAACADCHNYRCASYYTENKGKVLIINHNWRKKNKERWLGYAKEYSKVWKNKNQERYRALIKARTAKKEAMKKSLIHKFSIDDLDEVLIEFGNSCSLTDNEDFQIDHFIPLSWGHGGTYKENLHPLDSNLNLSKSNKNPFEWIKEHPEIPRERFDNLVRHFALANGLTPEDFRDFVYWCDEHRRSIDEVKRDPRPSIVIWREATGKHFQLPKYAIDELERLNSERRRSN